MERERGGEREYDECAREGAAEVYSSLFIIIICAMQNCLDGLQRIPTHSSWNPRGRPVGAIYRRAISTIRWQRTPHSA